MDDTLARLEQVFCDTFQRDDMSITRETSAGDIEGWDSLMHVNLVVNVEKAFKIRFRSSEVASLKNVGEFLDLIHSRIQG